MLLNSKYRMITRLSHEILWNTWRQKAVCCWAEWPTWRTGAWPSTTLSGSTTCPSSTSWSSQLPALLRYNFRSFRSSWSFRFSGLFGPSSHSSHFRSLQYSINIIFAANHVAYSLEHRLIITCWIERKWKCIFFSRWLHGKSTAFPTSLLISSK